MDLRKFYLKDTNGNASLTASAFAFGFVIVNLKLILSGMTVGGVELSPFTGSEYAAAIGALGAIYVLRRSTEKKGKKGAKNGK